METERIDWRYDTFIGRSIFKTGEEDFTKLDLKSFGSISFCTMEMACELLCDAIKKRKKILLNFSPGQIGPKTHNSLDTLKLLKTTLSDVLNGKKDLVAEIESYGEDKTEIYTIKGRKYEPFNSKQMKILRDLYEKRKDMKNYPNPFEYQPLIN